MDPDLNIELINQAIQKLLEEKRHKDASGNASVEDDDDQLLLSRLLSQLESLKGDGKAESSTGQEVVSSPAVVGKADLQNENIGEARKESNEISTQEIVKELRKVKRQNTITHWLLSAMIVLTVTWQLSEVSVLLKVKDRLNHPFRTFGGMFAGMLKGPGKMGLEAERTSSSSEEQQNLHIEGPPLPSIRMPELPHVNLPDLGLNDEE